MRKFINDSRVILFIDISIVACSFFFAYLLRFNFQIPQNELAVFKYNIFVFLAVRLLLFYLFKIHTILFKYTSTKDARNISQSILVGTLLFFLINAGDFFLNKQFLFPTSILLIEMVFSAFALMTYRLMIRNFYEQEARKDLYSQPVVIFGAGEAGVITYKTLQKELKKHYQVVAFFDDNKNLSGKNIDHIPVLNGDEDLKNILQKEKIDSLIIAVLNLPSKRKNEITDICLQYNVKVLHVPHASKWIDGDLTYSQLREIRIEELLEREPIQLDLQEIEKNIKNKVVLITGAAGSIGSELVRQAIRFQPEKLILVDQAETPMHDLQLELNAHIASIEFIIGDVCNEIRMEKIFATFRPTIVFHAAAYKHVPMMEDNPSEAILTNIKGTKVMADLSQRFAVDRFVLVSTDKAVNPSNIMGCTKRAAELYCQAISRHVDFKTKFITTRFGNVLGSNGSVIPLFKKQIAEGGPVTITHPDITRFFMTIPEACQLVLEAAQLGQGGEIYVFDMGESVKIADLAHKMIQLSGKEVGKDIEIKYTGLRPGEKLYEELLAQEENTLPTHHPKILIGKVKPSDPDFILEKINLLLQNPSLTSNTELVQILKELVPEYISNNSIYSQLDTPK